MNTRPGLRPTAPLKLTAAVISIAPLVTGQEKLYGTNGTSVLGVCKLDPSTLASDDCQWTSTSIRNMQFLTYDGSRLYFVDDYVYGWFPDTALHRVHPADLVGPQLGRTGINVFAGLDFDPQTGTLYAVADIDLQSPGVDLYTLNPQVGTATLVAPITGLAGPWVNALAIDSQGVGWMVSGAPPQTLYTLDLSTGSATVVGNIPGLGIPFATGFFLDLAFDSQDQLWGSYHRNSHPSTGLYRIDTATLTATQVSPFVFAGIAFVPSTDTTSYCTAK